MTAITLEAIRAILGWCTVINFGLLIVASIVISTMRGPMVRMHSRMFSLPEEDLSRAYFQYLAQYKIVVVVFNFVPYLALRILS